QLWWSVSDRIVVNQTQQSGALFRRIKRVNRRAPVQAYVGYWSHSAEMHADRRLPVALAQFGLLHPQSWKLTRGMRFVPPPDPARSCRPAGPAKPRDASRAKVAGAVPVPADEQVEDTALSGSGYRGA